MTALYDAIGRAFRLVDKTYDGVFVNILTDGMENDSKEFKVEDIKALIKTKRTKEKWAVTFMGTTEEALRTAEKWGIARSNMMQYDDSKNGLEKTSAVRVDAHMAYSASVFSSDTMFDIQDDMLIDDTEK